MRFIRILGNGINGPVCMTQCNTTYETYAIKCLTKNVKESRRELDLWNALRHENIVCIKHVKESADKYFAFMEVMETSLSNYIYTQHLSSDQIEWIFHECLCALEYCHKISVWHRDIKPHNILLNSCGTVKLCDFGLSCEVDRSTTLTNNVVTLWYRTPELLLGSTQYDSSIDIWAMCCVVYEMMYKCVPFWGENNSEISQLHAICRVIGPPTDQDFEKMKTVRVDIPQLPQKKISIPKIFQNVFVYNVPSRPRATDLLLHLKKRPQVFGIPNVRASYDDDWPEDFRDLQFILVQ